MVLAVLALLSINVLTRLCGGQTLNYQLPGDPICPLSDSAKHLLALDSDAMSWLLGVLFCWQDRQERKVIGCLRAATENGPCIIKSIMPSQ